MRQRTAAAASTYRHPLLAVRLWILWHRGLRERDAAVLAALRDGSRVLRRVAVPLGRVGLAELEFDDGRVVSLTGVHRPVAEALQLALVGSCPELIEGAHPGPVWALYFTVGAERAGRLALLALSAAVEPPSSGGTGRPQPPPTRPRQLVAA